MILYSRREGGERGEDFFMLLTFFSYFIRMSRSRELELGYFVVSLGACFWAKKEGTEGVARK
jgi:hypothetical protein